MYQKFLSSFSSSESCFAHLQSSSFFLDEQHFSLIDFFQFVNCRFDSNFIISFDSDN
jgi:hypothetical protein